MADMPGIFYKKDRKVKSASASQRDLEKRNKAKKEYAEQVRIEAKIKEAKRAQKRQEKADQE